MRLFAAPESHGPQLGAVFGRRDVLKMNPLLEIPDDDAQVHFHMGTNARMVARACVTPTHPRRVQQGRRRQRLLSR